jgi:hypothetical protein
MYHGVTLSLAGYGLDLVKKVNCFEMAGVISLQLYKII